MDGIICSAHPLPANSNEFQTSIGYTVIACLFQLSSVVLPVTQADPKLNHVTDTSRNTSIASDFNRATKEIYQNPNIFPTYFTDL
ncbi:unnamed protein product [Rotaria sp. Silwood2]|nr:unnamed protein product [Rotaria sp. Silwood2]